MLRPMTKSPRAFLQDARTHSTDIYMRANFLNLLKTLTDLSSERYVANGRKKGSLRTSLSGLRASHRCDKMNLLIDVWSKYCGKTRLLMH